MIVHKGHTGRVWLVAYSPDGKSVVSGSSDKTVRMWNAQGSSPMGEPLRGHTGTIYSISYSPLGNLIASASYDKTIRLWDPSTGQQSGEALKGDNIFYSVAFSPDAKLIASGSGGDSSSPTGYAVQLWNVQTRKAVSNPFKGHANSVRSVSFSPDGTRVASGSHDGTIRIWDAERGVAITEPLEEHTGAVRSTAFSPDGTQIVSCSGDGTIRFWDTRTGGAVGEPYRGHTDTVYSTTFSPGGTYIASGGKDKTVRLWDVRTGRQVDQSFEEHTDEVNSVVFSPCGQFIASGSDDRTVIIRRVLDEVPNANDATEPQTATSRKSTQQMFECLRQADCVDLSSQMDNREETAIIASGGDYGDIWQGKLSNGVKAAIKAWRNNPLETCDSETLERVAKELIDLFKMDHPNVHRLQGVIMFRDRYLGVVSDFMDNGNVYEYLLRCPNVDRYQLCAQVASGLEYMHTRGKVHGDVKAVNVVISSDGVAKLSHLDSSVLSEVKGLVFYGSSSIRWAAPEILLEDVQQKTTQTDVYALGMTMLEILTSQMPYPDCRSDISVIRTVERGTLPTRPKKLGNDHRGDSMWRLLLNCWSRNTSERPSSGNVAGLLKYM